MGGLMPRFVAVLLCAVAAVGLLGTAAVAQEEEGEAIRGRILQQTEEGENVPVEGVSVTVTTPDGGEIETVETDAEGSYVVELPEPGEYVVELDESTLPEGATLRNEDGARLETSVAPGQRRTLLFPLGEGSGGGRSQFQAALQLFVEGIKFGLIIAITAIGLSLIFGTTGLVNFAHGELVTFGAIIAWIGNVLVGLPLVLAGLVAIAVGAVFSGALDRFFWRPLRHRGTGLIAMLVISIGLSIFLRYIFNFQFGGSTRPYQAPYVVQAARQYGPILIADKDVFTLVVSVAVLIGVGLMLQKTRIGKAMRAVADNRDLAESSGINAEGVISFVWILGGALAALGGVLFGLAEQVSFQMGFQLLLLMFAGVTLGGLGTAYGALVGSLVVGIFVQMSTLVISPELKNVGALLVLILILLVRPQGILGTAERVG